MGKVAYSSLAKHFYKHSFLKDDKLLFGKRIHVKSSGGIACGFAVHRQSAREVCRISGNIGQGGWCAEDSAKNHQLMCGYKMKLLKGQNEWPSWCKDGICRKNKKQQELFDSIFTNMGKELISAVESENDTIDIAIEGYYSATVIFTVLTKDKKSYSYLLLVWDVFCVG